VKIAIPTHRRSGTINSLTLSLLGGFNPADIYIFISDEEDYSKYQAICAEYNLVLCNTKTATDKFNYIQGYFTGDDLIFVIEDDIKKIQSLMTNDLQKLFKFIEQYCRNKGIQAFGVYPSSNKFFMSKTIDIGLTYIVANLFGFIANTDDSLKCRLKTKTDYERSVRYYNTLGKIARFNFISCLTNNYKNKGGMQEDGNRESMEKEASLQLCAQYPDIFSLNSKRKSMYTEINMRKSVVKEKL